MNTKGWMLLVPLVGLTGCSAKYGCKGMPDDPTCMSAVEAYHATETRIATVGATEAEKAVSTEPSPSDSAPVSESSPVPRIEDPTPIRTPSQVMRIWIAPWEDAEGDLNVSGYVYTELEPRRWMIGKPGSASHPTLSPLQVQHRERLEERRSSAGEDKSRDTTIAPLYGGREESLP